MEFNNSVSDSQSISDLRQASKNKFHNKFLDIIHRYEAIKEDEGDEIDLASNKVVIDRGFLRQLPLTNFGAFSLNEEDIDDISQKGKSEPQRKTKRVANSKVKPSFSLSSPKSCPEDLPDLVDLCQLPQFDCFSPRYGRRYKYKSSHPSFKSPDKTPPVDPPSVSRSYLENILELNLSPLKNVKEELCGVKQEISPLESLQVPDLTTHLDVLPKEETCYFVNSHLSLQPTFINAENFEKGHTSKISDTNTEPEPEMRVSAELGLGNIKLLIENRVKQRREEENETAADLISRRICQKQKLKRRLKKERGLTSIHFEHERSSRYIIKKKRP